MAYLNGPRLEGYFTAAGNQQAIAARERAGRAAQEANVAIPVGAIACEPLNGGFRVVEAEPAMQVQQAQAAEVVAA